jgi:hypothetical protein
MTCGLFQDKDSVVVGWIIVSELKGL